MVSVALVGTWRYLTLEQLAWRGATMGMFSHVDAASNRLVRGVVVTDDGIVYASPPASIAHAVDRALVIPTEEHVADLGAAWREADPEVELVRVEVLRTVYASDPDEVRLEVITAVGDSAVGDAAVGDAAAAEVEP